MEADVEFLNYIYQNSEMGKNTMKELIEINNDAEFGKKLAQQQNEYTVINEQANALLEKYNKEAKGIGAMQNIKAYMMIKANTLTDKSRSHIADMLLQGSTKGIIDVKTNLNNYTQADQEIIDLANRLLKLEETNIEELKNFL